MHEIDVQLSVAGSITHRRFHLRLAMPFGFDGETQAVLVHGSALLQAIARIQDASIAATDAFFRLIERPEFVHLDIGGADEFSDVRERRDELFEFYTAMRADLADLLARAETAHNRGPAGPAIASGAVSIHPPEPLSGLVLTVPEGMRVAAEIQAWVRQQQSLGRKDAGRALNDLIISLAQFPEEADMRRRLGRFAMTLNRGTV